MGAARSSTAPQVARATEADSAKDAAPEPVERLLSAIEARPDAKPGALCVARVLSVGDGAATIAWRGSSGGVAARIAPEVEQELVREAADQRGAVLVEEGSPPTIVGLLQTRRPDVLKLRAGAIHIEGEREVLVRSGRAAVRLREDGDIEIVGGRIHAASRGLFRLVGRILRIN
jgi:hypothetical protein